jgi:aromatic-L-amino-acid/L-tryptophan decarboxylase
VTPDEFRAAGYALVDWIADYRTRVPTLRVQSQVAPGDISVKMPASAPATPQPFGKLIEDLDRVVVPGITQVQHPMNFGWFPANVSMASVLGDLASTGIGALGISWQSAPALTEMEEVTCAWMRDEVGLSDAWHGTIHDTASTACLVAMLLARERVGGHGQEIGGLQALDRPLVVYTSSQAHSSVAKAVLLAGFGRSNLREIDVDPATHAMRPAALEAAMAADAAAGRIPAAVVATVGTTATTAVDPVASIVPIAQARDVWVHVDAAMAGSAMLLPECRTLWDGVEGADSLSWNPHKWMGTALDTSLFYVRDVDHLVRVMSTSPSYLRSAADGDVTQYRDWGLPLGRRFRALKLWFHLHLDGLDAIRARIRRDLQNARWLGEQVQATPHWRVLAPVNLQTVCVRHEPPGLDGEALDRHTLAWTDAINRSGQAHLTPALVDGQWLTRISIGAEATNEDHIARVWQLIQESAAEH